MREEQAVIALSIQRCAVTMRNRINRYIADSCTDTKSVSKAELSKVVHFITIGTEASLGLCNKQSSITAYKALAPTAHLLEDFSLALEKIDMQTSRSVRSLAAKLTDAINFNQRRLSSPCLQ